MRHFCDDECEAVYRWSHPPRRVARSGHASAEKIEHARQKVRRLVALANDAAAAPPEANEAARIACRLIAQYQLLDRAAGHFTVEDFIRWARSHGVA